MADFYQTLELLRTATTAEVKTAYRRLARKWHPDTNKGEGTVDRFRNINEAYETLKDEYKRSIYDENLKNSERKIKSAEKSEETENEEKWKHEYDLVIKNNLVTKFFVTVFGVFFISLLLVISLMIFMRNKDSQMVMNARSAIESVDKEKVKAGFERVNNAMQKMHTVIFGKKENIIKLQKDTEKKAEAENKEEGIKIEGIKRGEKAVVVAK